jgi:hypothetical protein
VNGPRSPRQSQHPNDELRGRRQSLLGNDLGATGAIGGLERVRKVAERVRRIEEELGSERLTRIFVRKRHGMMESERARIRAERQVRLTILLDPSARRSIERSLDDLARNAGDAERHAPQVTFW